MKQWIWTQSHACTPNSGWCPFRFYSTVICPEFDYFSDNFSNYMQIPSHVVQVYMKKGSCFGVLFLPSNKNFPQQCPGLIGVKRFLILPRSLSMPIVLRNCFRIFVFSVSYLFICLFVCLFVYSFIYFYISSTSLLIWNFLICCLRVKITVSDKWVFLRSSLIRFDTIQPWVIISLNLHYFLFALYNFHILIPQILYVKLNTMGNICKWFQLNS